MQGGAIGGVISAGAGIIAGGTIGTIVLPGGGTIVGAAGGGEFGAGVGIIIGAGLGSGIQDIGKLGGFGGGIVFGPLPGFGGGGSAPAPGICQANSPEVDNLLGASTKTGKSSHGDEYKGAGGASRCHKKLQ